MLFAPVHAVIMRIVLMPQTLVAVSGVGVKGGPGMTYKPPAMRTNEMPIFLSKGACRGRSIQMGSNKMAKSVIIFRIFAESKAACWLMQVPLGIAQSQ